MVLKDLTALRGVAGNEKAVRDFIIEKASPLAEVRVDRMGNVFAYKKGKDSSRHVMLAAHMDEVGMIVTEINDKGFLSYGCCGGIDPRVVVSKRVLVGEKAVPGVIGAKAIHLQSGGESSSVMQHSSLYIDIGAPDKAAAEKLVSPGDYVSFDSDWVEFGNGLVKAKALDDRVGCAVMLALLEDEYPCDLTCVFTVQEETVCRGATTALDGLKDLTCAIVLEGTTANDLGNVPEYQRVCVPGKGAVISFMDHGTIAHTQLWRALRKLAKEKNINWQLKKYVSGGNDAGALQRSHGPLPTAVVNVACRYIHSPNSVAALADVDAVYQLTHAFLQSNAEF